MEAKRLAWLDATIFERAVVPEVAMSMAVSVRVALRGGALSAADEPSKSR
jgi:hypothetical protein